MRCKNIGGLQMNREKMTKRELEVECTERNIGFGKNWTKPFLINRLEEEDENVKAVNNPLKIWSKLHRERNNAKARLANVTDALKKLIAEKKILAEEQQKQLTLLSELNTSIETLGKTGIFGDYYEKDGMLHHDYDPTRKIK